STTSVEAAKFYAAIAATQQIAENDVTAANLAALHALVKHGRGYPFYYHDDEVAETISAKTLMPVKIALAPRSVSLSIRASGPFYHITGDFTIDGQLYPLHEVPRCFGYFLRLKDTLYLLDGIPLLGIVALLKEQEGRLLIHASKYREFRREFLDKLSSVVRIAYPDMKPGTSGQLREG